MNRTDPTAIAATDANRPGRVISTAQRLEGAHGDQRDVSDRDIDTHAKNLRRRLQAVRPEGDCIATVYGVGSRFDSPAP